MKFRLSAASLLLCGLAGTALAADMVLTPPSGGGVVINSSAATPGLRVAPGRQVQVPGLPTAASYSSVVCFDTNGNLGQCTAGVLGTPGPQGAVGPAGPAGPVGAAGAVGAAGPQGTAGAQGSVGPAGAMGSQGPQGIAGPVGPAGPIGASGPAGPAGPTGVTGATGPMGATGATGATGPQGPAGVGISGLVEARHGCFNAAGSVVAGTGFTVGVVGKVYTVSFTNAMGVANYTLVMDARASTGRSLAMGASTAASNAVLTVGWTEATETVSSICFMAAR